METGARLRYFAGVEKRDATGRLFLNKRLRPPPGFRDCATNADVACGPAVAARDYVVPARASGVVPARAGGGVATATAVDLGPAVAAVPLDERPPLYTGSAADLRRRKKAAEAADAGVVDLDVFELLEAVPEIGTVEEEGEFVML